MTFNIHQILSLLQNGWLDTKFMKNERKGREISDKSAFQIYECSRGLLIFIHYVFASEEITTTKIPAIKCETGPYDRFSPVTRMKR